MKFRSFDGPAQSSWAHGEGENIYCLKAGTNSRAYHQGDRGVDVSFPTLAECYNYATEGRNDTIIVTPENHSLSAALVWAKDMTHLKGSYSQGGGMNIRNRVGMSTTFTPMITVSGYGNCFEDIYTMHGTAGTDLIGWLISGERNYFRNVHFGGPMNAAQGGHASYEGVCVDGSECFFDNCIFGTDTVARDEVSPNVTLGPATKTRFRNCTFLCNLADGDPIFVKAENSSGYTWALFENCKFLALNATYSTPMTLAFDTTSTATCALILDAQCMFQNVTIVADATSDAYVHVARTHNTTDDAVANIGAVLTA